jgi:hypothetical protein
MGLAQIRTLITLKEIKDAYYAYYGWNKKLAMKSNTR